MTIPLPLVFKGAPGSPYTRKMLALLRYRRLPYRYLVAGSPQLANLPVPKVELLPTFYWADAAGTMQARTDSSPLLRDFDDAFHGRQARPSNPALALLDSLLEDYADEWLTKAMFHYRWHYQADIERAGDILPRWRGITTSDERAAELNRLFSQRQIDRLWVVGSNENTWQLIEDSYLRLLQAMENHFRRLPFLLGNRPGASDFAFFGQLTQLTHFDPTPMALSLKEAPRVFAWVDLLEDLCGAEPQADDWLDPAHVPETLLALLREVSRTYVPVMLANAQALVRGDKEVNCVVDGVAWRQQAFPYQGKCVRWLREERDALAQEDRHAVDRILEQSACLSLFNDKIGT